MKTGESEWSAEKVIMFYAATPNTDRETERKILNILLIIIIVQ